MSSSYNPSEVEQRWSSYWIDKGVFHAEVDHDKEPFTIVIPPPNITGSLHMGHALNDTIQDILIRSQRMRGKEALWLPGTDHAGIATQNVVERNLAAEGLRKEDLGREAFVERVWQWRKQYGNTIINQLKRLGASCDWQRERFTMDEKYSAAVRKVFVTLYEKGYIYRDKYIINWCPRCMTAISDIEVEYSEEMGNLYFIKYPGVDGDDIIVATTRPETMLGDTAV
ncbi:MAG: class I tRNA ligase family protein, partial [bacterium]|nr:class I tRNA ligase family protein [bacterium]